MTEPDDVTAEQTQSDDVATQPEDEHAEDLAGEPIEESDS
jgi:hypothetical protein